MKKLISVFALVAACGDNNGSIDTTPDSSTPDAPEQPFVAPTPVAVPLAAAGSDQLLGAVAATGGGFYAVGWRAPTHDATADREVVVVKLDGQGQLDTTFGGGDGIASINVQTGGAAEVFRSIVVQPSGKIVISGVVEDEVLNTDRDVALVRFNADGTPDTAFGTAGTGVVRLDLNTAINGMGLDTTWGLAVDAGGKLYVHAGQRTRDLATGGLDTLTDTDYVVVKLGVDGAVDTGWGDQGEFHLDIQRSAANVRSIHVLPDGSVLASGYADSPSLGDEALVQPVVYKLTPTGVLDTSFASGGLFHEVVLGEMTEVYGMAIQPDGKMVTAGYGHDAVDAPNDWISLRLTAAGALDGTWASGGKYLLDPTGTGAGDNCRHAIPLPGGRTALIGSGGPTTMTSDAYVVILDDKGKPDTKFGTGIMKFELGSNDALFGGAVATNGMRALFVGFKGGGATPSATTNDDAYVVSLSLQ